MTAGEPELALDALLEHAPFVRRLARALVRDAARADDLVQDAWIAAMRRPPKDAREARGWLASVTRRRASDVAKEEARRSGRERAVARTEAQPPPEIDERAELAARVLAAVRELREPYRTAIWLRYYEDASPRSIAKRLGVPVATVETRSRRARDLLRERLAPELRDDSSRPRAFFALAGLGQPELFGIASALKIATAVAAVPLLVVGARFAMAPGEVDANARAAMDGAVGPPRIGGELLRSASAVTEEHARRVAVVTPAPEEDTSAAAPSDAALLTGHVQAPGERNVCVGVVRRSTASPALVDEDVCMSGGTFSLSVPGGGTVYFAAAADGCALHSIELSLVPGERKDLGTIQLFEGERIDGFVRNRDGDALAGATLEAERVVRGEAHELLRLGEHRLTFDGGTLERAQAAVVSDERGRFELQGLDAAPYRVRATPVVEAGGRDINVFDAVGRPELLPVVVAPARNVHIALSVEEVLVRLRNDAGPLDGCSVAVDAWDTIRTSVRGRNPASELISFSGFGEFMVRYRTEDDLGLWVRRPGYRSELVRLSTLRRDADGELTIGLQSLRENSRLWVRIDCGIEMPPSKVQATLQSRPGARPSSLFRVSRLLDLQDGRALLDDVPAGEYELEIATEERPFLLPLRIPIEVLPRESTVDVSLELGGALELLPTRNMGKASDWIVRLRPSRGPEVIGRIESATELVADEPVALRPALTGGMWRIELRRDSVRWETAVRIEPGRATRVQVCLP